MSLNHILVQNNASDPSPLLNASVNSLKFANNITNGTSTVTSTNFNHLASINQDLGTAAAPTFVSLSVSNSSLSANGSLYLGGTLTGVGGDGYQYGLVENELFAPATNVTGQSRSISSSPGIAAPVGVTISNAVGLHSNLNYSGNVGTITNAYAIYGDTGSASAGTITNCYGGFFLQPVAGASLKCALYSDNLAVGYKVSPPASGGVIISGPVGIGTNAPNASAALDITSTTLGLKLPVMTQAQRTAMANVAGMVVYDSTNTAM